MQKKRERMNVVAVVLGFEQLLLLKVEVEAVEAFAFK